MNAGRTAVEDSVSSELILVVESDLQIGRAIVGQLIADGYQAELARTAEHARILARWNAPRLVVIGDLDSRRGALDLLEEIRRPRFADAPWAQESGVIVVSGTAQELDLLRAFEAGADDFLARPARYLELRARVRAILRRTRIAPDGGRAIHVGPLSIEPSGHSVSLNGQPLHLRPLEFQLLLHLACEPVRVFAKEDLLRDVWGYRCSGCTRTVETHASRLRRKLDPEGSGRWVINVWGVGYRLI